MRWGYKTSLVRCFQLQGFTYEELLDFCRSLKCQPPSKKNWKMEWLRCTNVRRQL